MPFGEHRVQCIHCGRQYTCGDCVTFTCPECDARGHRGLSLDCPICSREAAERRARIDAAIAARDAAPVPEMTYVDRLREMSREHWAELHRQLWPESSPEPEALDARDPVKRETV